MTVPSLPFLAFAAVAALLFHLGRASWWRRSILLAANLIFFVSFVRDPLALLPFAGFLTLGYVAQRITRNGSDRALFAVLLVLTIAVFLWLKRYSFVPGAILLSYPYMVVGLSYVFFRVAHLIIDSHQGEVEAPVGPLSYLNYTLNFTALISGPIQRYQDYHAMELQPLPLDLPAAGRAVERIIIGYFKVAILSMLLGQLQHLAIDQLTAAQPWTDRVWTGVEIAVLYPVYLYANFSGYMDVVIGVGRFFGIVLPENFDRPFSSESFLIFWSRWHMTLSGWLKTYVYNPLMLTAANRVSDRRWLPYIAVMAFFVTFFLVGLWHGQTSQFIFYGFLQGGGIAANKLYQIWMQQRLGPKGYHALTRREPYRMAARGLTFTWFTLTLFWFWSSWEQIGHFTRILGTAGVLATGFALFLGASMVLALLEALHEASKRVTWNQEPLLHSRYLRTAAGTALAAITTTVILLLDSPAPDIVYKSF